MVFLFYRKEVKSAKSAKPASTPKATKEAKSPKVKSKEKVGSAFEFVEEEVAPESKKPKTTAPKGKLLFKVFTVD